MIWPFRKASSNGWQRLARGADIPAKPGQKFDIRLSDRDEIYGLIVGQVCEGVSLNGTEYVSSGLNGNWWNRRGGKIPVTHYRLHEPETADDVAVRANRENLWRDLAANPNADVGGFEEPTRQPVKVR